MYNFEGPCLVPSMGAVLRCGAIFVEIVFLLRCYGGAILFVMVVEYRMLEIRSVFIMVSYTPVITFV